MRDALARLSMRIAAAWWALALKLRSETPRAAIERRFDEAAAEAMTAAPRRRSFEDIDVPEGYLQVEPRGITGTPIGGALLLVDEAEERYVPIFIGGTEALAVDHRLQGRSFPRPLPYDLFEHLLLAVGAELTGVRIDSIDDDVFIATLVVHLSEERQIELDARASDAIILALGRGAPIVVSKPVFDRSSRPMAEAPAA